MYQNENPHRGLPSLQNYQNWQFFLNFSDLNTRNWFFLIIQISMGFPYITDVVFSVLPTCYQTSSFFTHWGHSHYKVPLIIGQFASVACCVYNFYSGTWYRTWITEFWPPPLEQQLKLILKFSCAKWFKDWTSLWYNSLSSKLAGSKLAPDHSQNNRLG